MTEKPRRGQAFKQTEKDRAVKRATSRRLNALEKEWVADSEQTRDQLIARQAAEREAMYQRNPHLRAA